MSAPPRALARLEDVRSTFQNHYRYYLGLKGETIAQQLKAEAAAAQQYAGRADLELLQNALDACESTVWVGTPDVLGRRCLVVGNDGTPVSVDPSYDYESPSDGSTRSDFHALCSLFTSNKTPDQQIGNKGVGFRSVFSVADTVQVWSRTDGGWWGLELQFRLTREGITQRRGEDPALGRGVLELLREGGDLPATGNRWPSFYFPQPLWSPAPPVAADGLVTFVIAPLRDSVARASVERGVQALGARRLYFVGLRDAKVRSETPRRAITTRLLSGNGESKLLAWPGNGHPWHLRFWPPTPEHDSPRIAKLRDLATAAGTPIERPGAAISLPTERELERLDELAGGEGWFGAVHAYLPTDVRSPGPFDLHGDFVLGLDRKNLDLKDTAVGEYNRALAAVAAELYVGAALGSLGVDAADLAEMAQLDLPNDSVGTAGAELVARDDLWRLLAPSRDQHSDSFNGAMERILFAEDLDWTDVGAFARWSTIAARFFGTPRPLTSFKEFWSATDAWRERAAGRKAQRSKQYRIAAALCDALRTTAAQVVPLGDDDGRERMRGVPLPSTQAPGQTGARNRVFLRKGEGDSIPLPATVLKRGRSITTFESDLMAKESHFTDSGKPRPTGIVDLDRWELLTDLRQLSTRGVPTADTLTEPEQLELLRFAASLFTVKLGQHDPPAEQRDRFRGPAWRTEGGDNQRRAGRSIATLYLPVREGGWAPARQLCRVEVDDEPLKSLQLPGTTLDEFLCFLGVSPGEGPAVLEGGASGVVPVAAFPPQLCDAGSGERADRLRLVGRGGRPLELAHVRSAWKSWLGALVHSEETDEFAQRSEVREQLSSEPWYPVHEADGATPPVGAREVPTFVPPSTLAISPAHADRRYKLLWRGPRERDGEMLRQLGALPSLTPEDLGARDAQHARDLLTRLTYLDLPTIQADPDARAGLRALYDAALAAFVRAAPPDAVPPLLVYSPSSAETSVGERQLAWARPGEAWLCSDSDREAIRRRFPDLPVIVTAPEWRLMQLRPALGARVLKLRPKLDRVPTPPGFLSIAAEIRERLDAALPGLLALAEVKQIGVEYFDVDEAFERWRNVRIVEVAEVRETVTIHSPSGSVLGARVTPPAPDGDVYSLRSEGRPSDDPPDEILFARAANTTKLQLHLFAEALAATVRNPLAYGLWAQALLEFEDPARWTSLLARTEATAIERAYQRRRRGPLSETEEAAIRVGLSKALEAVGCELLHPGADLSTLLHLGPGSVRVLPEAAATATEAAIRGALRGIHTPIEAFRPTFHCVDANRARWEQWIEATGRRDRLLAFARSATVGAGDDATAGHLDQFAESRFELVAFDPSQVAFNWLREWKEDLGPAELDAVLEPPVVFAEVRAMPSAGGGWTARRLGPSAAPKVALGTPAGREWDEKAKHQRARGRAAEDALVGLVSRATTEALTATGEVGWAALRAVRPRNRVGNKLWAAARDSWGKPGQVEALRSALHVSAYCGNAGYDILGLKVEQGAAMPFRYEVKAIEPGSQARVFLSRNELAVWSACSPRGPQPGTWHLVAVDRVGNASDLTEFLEPLAAKPVLRDLLDEGFQVDTIVLVVERPGLAG